MWQPIATVPKEGLVDLWGKIDLWGQKSSTKPYEHLTNCWHQDGEWWTVDNWSDHGVCCVINPTHWMQMPKPPEGER